MGQVSEDFKRFLEANCPDDLLKISSADVKDDIITAICSRHEKNYKIWSMVPEWIKNIYQDKLPQEIYNGHEPLDKFIIEIEQAIMIQIPYDSTKLTAFVYDSIINDPESCKRVSDLMDNGNYQFETAANLQYNSNRRKKLIETEEINTPKGKAIWRETRKEDCKLINDDWKEHQPEKFVLHQIKTYFRSKTNFNRLASIDEETLTEEQKQKRIKDLAKYTKQTIQARKDYELHLNQVKDEELRQEYSALMSQIEKNIERQSTFEKIKELNIRVNIRKNKKPQSKEEALVREELDKVITTQKANKISDLAIQNAFDRFGLNE